MVKVDDCGSDPVGRMGEHEWATDERRYLRYAGICGQECERFASDQTRRAYEQGASPRRGWYAHLFRPSRM